MFCRHQEISVSPNSSSDGSTNRFGSTRFLSTSDTLLSSTSREVFETTVSKEVNKWLHKPVVRVIEHNIGHENSADRYDQQKRPAIEETVLFSVPDIPSIGHPILPNICGPLGCGSINPGTNEGTEECES
ncbi:unnamed protein product [Medioppia subpectinata]|uniref:Uncharacterized protein n=1 Tax=Medioppia subpectinata TaxID=1979941 RepID=A0A7R9Q9H2_9ACAR|nr:unnamed protein product [Medioppia subpectinata]CAG2116382.1 unnamed protein product [Medioppia subpectinata]